MLWIPSHSVEFRLKLIELGGWPASINACVGYGLFPQSQTSIAAEDFGLFEHLLSLPNGNAIHGSIGGGQRWRGSSISSYRDLLFWPFALSLAVLMSCCTQVISLPGDYSRLNSRFSDTEPALSGNGRFVVMVTNRGGRQDLALYDIQQKRFVDLPRLNRRNALVESPSLSRSARYIAYVVSERGRPEIALYDRVTQRRQLLTRGFRGPIRNPSISPDGRYVAFESGRRGQWDIEVLDRGASVQLDLSSGTSNRDESGASPGQQSNGQ